MLEQYPGSFLTVKEIAVELRMTEKTVRNQMSQKRFPIEPVRIGSKVLFPKPRVMKFLKEIVPESTYKDWSCQL